MSPIVVKFNSGFEKKYKKYPQKQQKEIWGKIELFKNNPLDPSLNTHKLTGKFKDYWSFSVSYSMRIMFWYLKDGSIGFVDIGGHEIYK